MTRDPETVNLSELLFSRISFIVVQSRHARLQSHIAKSILTALVNEVHT